MMLNYNIVQLNSPFDDSVFFVRNIYHRKAMLFDCGRLGNLSHTDILSLSDIFVSHTHMDHFFGFDRIIRGSIIGEHELRIYGPEGFINNINGKFQSYTWNLAEDYKFRVKAYELNQSGNHKIAYFNANNKFIPKIECFSGNVLDINDGFSATFEFFDHRIPTIGYRISEPKQFHIKKECLNKFGYIQGKWIKELKNALEKQQNINISVPHADGIVNKTSFELKYELVEIKEPQVITYITDIAPTEENIEKAVNFAKNSSLLIIEAVFLDKDIDHAILKNHLTVGISKNIFKKSHSDMVRFTHFASRYEQDKTKFINELYNGLNGKIYTKGRV